MSGNTPVLFVINPPSNVIRPVAVKVSMVSVSASPSPPLIESLSIVTEPFSKCIRRF
jgi:hypothetical protein